MIRKERFTYKYIILDTFYDWYLWVASSIDYVLGGGEVGVVDDVGLSSIFQGIGSPSKKDDRVLLLVPVGC